MINQKGEFVDDLKIKDIILSTPENIISDIIDHRYISLNVHDSQEEANNIFKMNNRVALPVVDDNNILLGIVTIDDVLWVANEEFTENIQKIGGTEALDEPYLEMPLFKLFRKRVGWLIILFIGEMLTATAMSYFEDEIAKAIVLALFVPLIISSGGNSGSQASTLIIQAMAMGEVYLSDWMRVLKERSYQAIAWNRAGIDRFLQDTGMGAVLPRSLRTTRFCCSTHGWLFAYWSRVMGYIKWLDATAYFKTVGS